MGRKERNKFNKDSLHLLNSKRIGKTNKYYIKSSSLLLFIHVLSSRGVEGG